MIPYTACRATHLLNPNSSLGKAYIMHTFPIELTDTHTRIQLTCSAPQSIAHSYMTCHKSHESLHKAEWEGVTIEQFKHMACPCKDMLPQQCNMHGHVASDNLEAWLSLPAFQNSAEASSALQSAIAFTDAYTLQHKCDMPQRMDIERENIVNAISQHLHKTLDIPHHSMREMLALLMLDMTCKIEHATQQHENPVQHNPWDQQTLKQTVKQAIHPHLTCTILDKHKTPAYMCTRLEHFMLHMQATAQGTSTQEFKHSKHTENSITEYIQGIYTMPPWTHILQTGIPAHHMKLGTMYTTLKKSDTWDVRYISRTDSTVYTQPHKSAAALVTHLDSAMKSLAREIHAHTGHVIKLTIPNDQAIPEMLHSELSGMHMEPPAHEDFHKFYNSMPHAQALQRISWYIDMCYAHMDATFLNTRARTQIWSNTKTHTHMLTAAESAHIIHTLITTQAQKVGDMILVRVKGTGQGVGLSAQIIAIDREAIEMMQYIRAMHTIQNSSLMKVAIMHTPEMQIWLSQQPQMHSDRAHQIMGTLPAAVAADNTFSLGKHTFGQTGFHSPSYRIEPDTRALFSTTLEHKDGTLIPHFYNKRLAKGLQLKPPPHWHSALSPCTISSYLATMLIFIARREWSFSVLQQHYTTLIHMCVKQQHDMQIATAMVRQTLKKHIASFTHYNIPHTQITNLLDTTFHNTRSESTISAVAVRLYWGRQRLTKTRKRAGKQKYRRRKSLMRGAESSCHITILHIPSAIVQQLKIQRQHH
jgi:hypothetical protein